MIWVVVVLACQMLLAQQAELHKAAERFRGIRSLKMNVVQTRHNVTLIKDITTLGHFFYQEPNRCSMVFPDAKEMLLAVDDTFVMVRDGKQHVAKAKDRETIRLKSFQTCSTNCFLLMKMLICQNMRM